MEADSGVPDRLEKIIEFLHQLKTNIKEEEEQRDRFSEYSHYFNASRKTIKKKPVLFVASSNEPTKIDVQRKYSKKKSQGDRVTPFILRSGQTRIPRHRIRMHPARSLLSIGQDRHQIRPGRANIFPINSKAFAFAHKTFNQYDPINDRLQLARIFSLDPYVKTTEFNVQQRVSGIVIKQEPSTEDITTEETIPLSHDKSIVKLGESLMSKWIENTHRCGFGAKHHSRVRDDS